jgi:hypothetical protein
MRLLPTPKLLSILFVCGVMLIVSGQAVANRTAPDRAAQFAKLPNWSGVWDPVPQSPNAPPSVDPIYNAAWVIKQKSHSSKAPPAEAVDNVQSRCVWGMPRLLKSMRSFEVILLPEQTFFSYDINEFRHVWTDGRKHTLRQPTNTGHSIGHWEGATLVIETTGMQSGLWINHKGATLSPKAIVQERWSMMDNDHLKVDVSVLDNTSLAKPFVFTRRFQRADTNRLVQQQCFEESRDTRKEF